MNQKIYSSKRLGNLAVDKKRTLKWLLKKQGGKACTVGRDNESFITGIA
jgi:hypothetical protein